MSNEKQPENELIDSLFIMVNGAPLAIVPNSDRCKSLFMRWGMDDDVDGLVPPDDPMDFIQSVPKHWLCGLGEQQKEEYLLQEIPLPQPMIVLQ